MFPWGNQALRYGGFTAKGRAVELKGWATQLGPVCAKQESKEFKRMIIMSGFNILSDNEREGGDRE